MCLAPQPPAAPAAQPLPGPPPPPPAAPPPPISQSDTAKQQAQINSQTNRQGTNAFVNPLSIQSALGGTPDGTGLNLPG